MRKSHISSLAWLGLGLLVGIPAGWLLRAPSSTAPPTQREAAAPTPPPPLSSSRRLPAQSFQAGSSPHSTREAAAEIERVLAAAAPGQPNAALVTALVDILGDSFGSRRMRRFTEMLEAMRPEDAEAVREIFRQQDTLGRYHEQEFVAFWDRWGQIDGAGALAYIQEKDARQGASKAVDVFKAWSARDPHTAAQTALSLEKGELRDRALKGVAHGWTETDLAAATKFILGHMPVEELPQLGGDMVWSIAYSASAAEARQWFAGLGEIPLGFRQHATEALVELSGRDSPAAVLEAAQVTIDNTSALEGSWPSVVLDKLSQMNAHTEYLQSLELLAERSVSVDQSEFFRRDPSLATAASEWLRAHPDSPAFDFLAVELVREAAADDPHTAAQWAAAIRNPLQRKRAETLLVTPAAK